MQALLLLAKKLARYNAHRHHPVSSIEVDFPQWKKAIDDNILLPNEKPLPVVLLGNKCEDADVDNAQMERYAQEKSFAKFFDTSAKDNINIEEAVRFLVEKILEHQDILQQKKAPKVYLHVWNHPLN